MKKAEKESSPLIEVGGSIYYKFSVFESFFWEEFYYVLI